MGTTDNFDSSASGALALTDTFPVISAATSRAATATLLQLRTFSGNNFGVTDAITAFATGGQASGTALTTTLNRITTCATIGDSVKLGAATAGKMQFVFNGGATPCDVFPATGDAINALTANTALRLNNGSQAVFVCNVAGTWTVQVPQVPAAKFVSINATAGTLAAGNISGAAFVSLTSTNATPGNQTTRTATQMFADQGNVQPGDAYMLRITQTGAGTLTLLAGSGVTLTGTMTVPTNTTRDFVVTFTSATALVIQAVGTGTYS